MTNRKDAEARAREVLVQLSTDEFGAGRCSDCRTLHVGALMCECTHASWEPLTVPEVAALALSLASEVQREAIERAAKVAQDEADDIHANAPMSRDQWQQGRMLMAHTIAVGIRSLNDSDHADVDGSRGYFADDITYAGAPIGDPVQGEGR